MSINKKKLNGLLLALALIAVGTLVTLFPERNGPQGLLTRLERVTYDARLRIRGEVPATPEIVIVTIDDESIRILDKRLGDFTRHDYARVIRNLGTAGAAIVGVDLLFTQPSRSNTCDPAAGDVPFDGPAPGGFEAGHTDGAVPGGVSDQIGERSPKSAARTASIAPDEAGIASEDATAHGEGEAGPVWDLSDPDQDLAAAIAEAGNVVLARYVAQGVAQEPLELLLYGAYSQAIITLTPDSDGVVRSLPLLEIQALPDGQVGFYRTMGFEVVAPFMPEDDSGLSLTAYGARYNNIDLYGQLGNYYINYSGPSGTYTRVPFGRIWSGDFAPEEIADKIIMIGNIHPSAHDYYSTPFDQKRDTSDGEAQIEVVATQMPGIEIHANVAQALLEGRHTRFFIITAAFDFLPAFSERVYSTLWLILIGLLCGYLFIVSSLSIPIRTTLFALGMGGYVLAVQILFERTELVLQVTPYLSMLFLTFAGGVIYQAVTEGAEKARITRTFGQYVSPQVVAELVADPTRAQLGGEKRVMTVMFSDIRGFTTLSEKMDPVALVNFLNEYLSAMTDIIFAHGGVVDKYMGDAIMAFWGAPLLVPDHAERAAKACLDSMAKLQEMQAEWRERGLPELDIGIGLNTGHMTVGNMGSHVRFDYTVMGDSVNLGSRLEGINKEYGTHIIISEFTREQLSTNMVCRELDLVAVKGKKEPVRIFELMADGPTPELTARINRYMNGLRLYRAKRFDEAKVVFNEVLERYPDDGPSKIYIRRCDDLLIEPPPEVWDGVYVMKTK
jgi:adenylate cyclase